MKKVIVTTTINRPTAAIELFDALTDWTLVVIGDKKTPTDYHLSRGLYVSPETQEKYDPALSSAIGWNCIQRRNFGLLWAYDLRADVIAVVDDDNIPYPGWGDNLLLDRPVEVNYYETDLPAFDPVGATNEKHLWHRGFPLALIPQRSYAKRTTKKMTFDIQADFWDGDPDIDAVCRMIYAPECKFSPESFPLAGNQLSPFNSQNTFLTGQVLADYFLFPHIGRMDDIWAAYYLQALCKRVVYNKASVYQQRNVHNLVKDMQNEYLGYEKNLELVKQLPSDHQVIFNFLPEKSRQAFQLYRQHFRGI